MRHHGEAKPSARVHTEYTWHTVRSAALDTIIVRPTIDYPFTLKCFAGAINNKRLQQQQQKKKLKKKTEKNSLIVHTFDRSLGKCGRHIHIFIVFIEPSLWPASVIYTSIELRDLFGKDRQLGIIFGCIKIFFFFGFDVMIWVHFLFSILNHPFFN